MEKTVGDTDRMARLVLGVISGLLSIAVLVDVLPEAISLPEIASPILGVVALVLLATAFTEKCAIYSALGMDTK